MNRTISTVGLAAAFVVGCGSTVPPARIASSEAAVQAAREAGAERVPAANKHLQAAEDELVKAKGVNSTKDREAAEAHLERAEADAALAAALADEARQKQVPMEEPTPQGKRAKQPERSR